MGKRFWLSVFVVFVVSVMLDMIIHGGVLAETYAATASLWRPMEEMNGLMPLIWLGTLVFCFFFVFVFGHGYQGKGIAEGARYGVYMGLIVGAPMTVGTYATMPVPALMPMIWFLGKLLQCILAGVIVAKLYGPEDSRG